MEIRGLSSLDPSNAIAMAVAKKALDAQRREGRAMLDMLQSAADTGRTTATAPEPTNLGRMIDVQA